MPWKKGQSGNPNGRAKVDTAAARAAMRETISKSVPAIVKKLTALAIAGDVQAARTLLERVLPAIKPENLTISLPDVTSATTATEQAAKVVHAASIGALAPDVAGQLLAGIGLAAKVREVDELEQRIRALEGKKP